MTRPRTSRIWWLHPVFVFATAGTSIGIAAYAIPESVYRQYWRTPKFFGLPALEITLGCVAVFVLGVLLSSGYFRRAALPPVAAGPAKLSPKVMMVLFRLSFYLCLIGYVIWTGLAIYRGMRWQDVIDVAQGKEGAMYEARFVYLPTVGGVTTLTEFGTAAMILGAILGFTKGWRGVRGKLFVILGLAFVRALVNSERFALIELVVPFLITSLAFLYVGRQRVGRRTRLLVGLAPLIGFTGLLVLFTSFEYFRSWSNYYEGRDLNLVEFGASRLAGYYVTSFNNGAYLVDRLDPLDAPYFTLHFFWNFPLSSPVIRRLFPDPILQSTDKWFYFPFLESGANLEFNNADGMMLPLMDYGIAGGLIWWFLTGLGCGFVYEMYCRREPLGLLVFPVIYLGLMEMPLAFYWGDGRAFPSQCLLLGTPLLLWVIRRQFPSRLPATMRPAAVVPNSVQVSS